MNEKKEETATPTTTQANNGLSRFLDGATPPSFTEGRASLAILASQIWNRRYIPDDMSVCREGEG